MAMSRGSKSFFENAEVDVLCLPRMHEAAIPAAAFALQWVKVHHGRVAQLDLRHTLGMTALVEVAAMLLPWLTFTRLGHSFPAKCRGCEGQSEEHGS